MLVDTPPSASGPDLQLFAAFGGGALVVTRKAASPDKLERLRKLLAACRAQVVGTVIAQHPSPAEMDNRGDDRGYVAQALFDRFLSGDGVPFRILGETRAIRSARRRKCSSPWRAPRWTGFRASLGLFCREFDLQLVHLAPEDSRAWRCGARLDRRGRAAALHERAHLQRLLPRRALLPARRGAARRHPDTLFSHALVDAVERGELDPETAAWLCAQWTEDPRSAIERVARFWPDAANVRLIAQAAKHGEWTPVRAALGALRRALRRAVWPDPGDVLARIAVAARTSRQPARVAVVFMGREARCARRCSPTSARPRAARPRAVRGRGPRAAGAAAGGFALVRHSAHL